MMGNQIASTQQIQEAILSLSDSERLSILKMNSGIFKTDFIQPWKMERDCHHRLLSMRN